MKNIVHSILLFTTLCSAILFLQGCSNPHHAEDGHDHSVEDDHDHSASASGSDSHAALHQTKYNQTLVEFPGHLFAMEIFVTEHPSDKVTTNLVTASLTDAHFNPIEVDTEDVRLNFMIDETPKTFVLTRAESEQGKPATFTVTDIELATLNRDGWQGEATALVDINGTPFSAPLRRLHRHK